MTVTLGHPDADYRASGTRLWVDERVPTGQLWWVTGSRRSLARVARRLRTATLGHVEWRGRHLIVIPPWGALTEAMEGIR